MLGPLGKVHTLLGRRLKPLITLHIVCLVIYSAMESCVGGGEGQMGPGSSLLDNRKSMVQLLTRDPQVCLYVGPTKGKKGFANILV